MLSGLAVECLLKALWVKRGNRLASNGRYVRIPGAGDHDLVQLSAVLHFALSDFEKEVLTRLSHFIEYGGRYPVPRDADKLTLAKSPHGGQGPATTWNTPHDQRRLEAIIGRLSQLVE